ncbi:hypothetical protein [Pseudoduganella sp. UC29_71]|uniref:hypothetical protein n=1 Tax=Pseudoduganella sp. UC29_71 TaxID=3350174 RepID=UPI00366A6B97
MLIVRQTQLVALGRVSEEQAIDELCHHLNTYYPQLTASLSSAQQRTLVQSVMQLAASYKLRSQRDICRFLNLAATYGSSFNSDPQLGWMLACLVDHGVDRPSDRLDLLIRQCQHRNAMAELSDQQRALFDRTAQQAYAARELEYAEAWLSRELHLPPPIVA